MWINVNYEYLLFYAYLTIKYYGIQKNFIIYNIFAFDRHITLIYAIIIAMGHLAMKKTN